MPKRATNKIDFIPTHRSLDVVERVDDVLLLHGYWVTESSQLKKGKVITPNGVDWFTVLAIDPNAKVIYVERIEP